MLTADEREEFEELLFEAIREAAGDWQEEFVKSIYKHSLNPLFTPTAKQTAKLYEIAGNGPEDQEWIPF